MTNAAIYCRVDHDSSKYGQVAIDCQRKQMERYAKLPNMYITGCYADCGFTGRSMNRPALQQLLQDHAKGSFDMVKELYEKGVSGFKKSAKERDAIQELQQDAIEGKFDILLVYMFDRLGRKDDETPFVVEWFVKNGIEVWSAVEGQQRFDNHVDKLLNYIRYRQASGESIKTSVRVKTQLEQLTESGLFTGGTVPYGYRLVKNGRTNKRNKEVFDLAIDETAAEIVRLIFYKYVYEGYGAQRISRYLMEMNIRREDGSDFPNTSLVRMLKNKIYTGIIHNGDVESEVIPDLQIIDTETFDRAQELMKDRTQHRTGKSSNLSGRSLLVGNVLLRSLQKSADTVHQRASEDK